MNDYNDIRLKNMLEHRAPFKKMAMLTSGMPNGNKALHVGHIMMWTHTDIFARFLRDRLGKDNVLHVSGTDSFGSPVEEGYRKATEAKEFSGTIKEYALSKHAMQLETFADYQIGVDLFSGSCMDNAVKIHEQTGKELFDRLKELGYLEKLTTYQFYDSKLHCLLNGRQVIGKCPIDGCQSEKAYADECDLGHQYMPEQLIDPVSVLSGEKPELRKVANWYFDLDKHIDLLKDWIEYLKKTPTREYVLKEISEFLKDPEIYIKQEYYKAYCTLKDTLPEHKLTDETKPSFTIIFDKLSDRETACDILSNAGVRYRTGKTLVPFRLTGNSEWGLPAPSEDNEKLTFWVWPESLWAPVSFTKQYLVEHNRDIADWKKYWCNKDCQVYQFIGQDNIYFYGPAQTAMWLCSQGKTPSITVPDGDLTIPQMISDKHILFLGKKAGSSSKIKAPLAHELLNYYTAEQLRMHFLAMNVGNNNASFMPKPYNPDADPNEVDPVIREGNLLTNVFNRVLRTLFYTWQKDFDGIMPYGQVEQQFLIEGMTTMLKYEKLMYDNKFHMISYELDSYIRNINKYWVKQATLFSDINIEKQTIINTLHMVRVALLLLHPVAPVGTENVAKYLGVNESIFDWNNMDKTIYDFMIDKENHKPTELKPREDFFKKHPCQLDDAKE